MSKRANHNALEVGDKVRVKMSTGKAGETLYVIIDKDAQGFGCTIREVPDGHMQRFDTSLLLREPNAAKTTRAMRDAMRRK